ncbi:hypothetical protein [Streptomyces wuyuanensis]|uniref:hypothetical protein n=1 Tax=Streptomyces wuyuanensis TaxID=1196353 RepID=UPI00341D76E6
MQLPKTVSATVLASLLLSAGAMASPQAMAASPTTTPMQHSHSAPEPGPRPLASDSPDGHDRDRCKEHGSHGKAEDDRRKPQHDGASHHDESWSSYRPKGKRFILIVGVSYGGPKIIIGGNHHGPHLKVLHGFSKTRKSTHASDCRHEMGKGSAYDGDAGHRDSRPTDMKQSHDD